MNSNPIYNTTNELISQGDTDQALQILIAYLEKDAAYPETLHTLRVIESNFRSARKQEAKGLLAFSEAQREYAKTNDTLISILDDLKAGRKPSPVLTGTGDGGSSAHFPWLIGGAVLLLGILAFLWVSRTADKTRNNSTDIAGKPLEDNGLQCPSFRPNSSKVMILPFQNSGGEIRKPELSVQTRIRELTTKNQLATDVEIISVKQFETSPPDLKDAIELGKQCQADMVIWGQFEAYPDNSISVDIRYAFTEADWPPGAAIQTFKNVTEIRSDRIKIDNLDEAIFRICTALALHKNRLELAGKWLNKIQKPNLREQEWKEILSKR